MLILGILAAIALPAFFNQKEKAGDAKAKEYAHSAQVAMETYFTEHSEYASGVEAGEGLGTRSHRADVGERPETSPFSQATNNSYTITSECVDRTHVHDRKRRRKPLPSPVPL